MSRIGDLSGLAPTPAAAPPTVVVTVTPLAAQLTLAPGVPTVAATVDGAPATITAWAWSVTGPASYADDTIAAPTLTPTAGGTLGLACAVTIGGVVYRSAVVEWEIGKYVASLGRHVALRAAIDYTAEATASWTAAGATPTTRALGGYDHTSRNANRATAFGVVAGSGIQVQNDNSASNRTTAPLLDVLVQEIIPGWTYDDALVVQVEFSMSAHPDGSAYVGLALCSEVPTAVTGEYVVVTGYERVATGVPKVFVDRTINGSNASSGTTTASGTVVCQELVYGVGGAVASYYTTDPAGTPPDPGTGTQVPAVAATPSDTAPVTWVGRSPGTVHEDPAAAHIALVHHAANDDAVKYIERLWVWA